MPLPLREVFSPAAAATRRPAALGALERLPKWVICIPLVLQWIVLGIRYRSLSLPTAANPRITAGGMVGEGKLEYFAGMGPVARAATARHIGLRVEDGMSAADVQARMAAGGLGFPVVAKPDLGLCGHGVRRVDGIEALMDYLGRFPQGEVVVLQEYLAQPGEAGIFYARDPATGRGRIIGLALRDFPRVVGDGVRSIAALAAADPRARRLLASPLHDLTRDLSQVPAAGELVRLSTIGSTRVGGLYRDAGTCITPALVDAVDAIARDMPEFYFGRFDVRFDSLADLACGRGLRIMEVNGAGSEAIEAWDPDTPLWRGFALIFAKQRLLFEIAHARRQAGTQPLSLLALAALHLRQQRLIASYPPSN
ncbi:MULTISPECIES: hypothetical protein [Ramlibacter]|uniref:D-alanine--D-alanine ligase n=1 Tax=Ramlibacter aquaticus TaxID=2780094 RepID=A0ABR9S9Q7_9BURK|nr:MULTISPECIES: hypothetical protein [Ramlibacter]MBE7939088.1 hypothetical protein [Ramlibacter aquaticus]